MAGNSNGHVCYASQDLYTCMSEMHGYLLKKEFFGKKSKRWCCLQESILCMQKSNAPDPQRHSAKTIDLKDCHQVRKVTAEITGAHFEICQRKKTYVFICPTSENCTRWVKALHAAMALKDVGNFDSDPVADCEKSTILACDNSLRHSKQNVASCQIDYCDPSDVQKVRRVGNKDNESTEIDAQACADSATSDSMKSTDVVDLKDDVSDSMKSTDGVDLKDDVSDSMKSTDVLDLKDDVSDSMKSTDVLDLKDDVSDNEDECPFKAVLDFLSCDLQVPEIAHPLIEEDLKPVEDLREFLSINRELCQVNYVFHSKEDPVASLKSYLETLSITKCSSHSEVFESKS